MLIPRTKTLALAAAALVLLSTPRLAAQSASPPPPGSLAPSPAPGPRPVRRPPSGPRAVRRPAEVFAHIGLGDAVCDKNKPTSDCPVQGAFATGIGGAWRFHPHWAAGLELAFWSFGVRDEWKGQLVDPATDVSVRSLYVTPFVRWYWFDHDAADPYLHFGIGYGSLQVEASNDVASYEVRSGGVAVPLGIGVEWHVSDLFRLGPEALAFLLLSSTICETENGRESCRDPGSEPGTRQDEGNALPWRLSVVGTFMFGP